MTDTDERQAGDEIEVTEEMIEAGLETLYGFRITEPSRDEMGDAVREVYVAMREAARK